MTSELVMPLDLRSLQPLALGSMRWRNPVGDVFLTVIAKATFSLVRGGVCALAAPGPLGDDRFAGEPGRSGLVTASDRVPYKPLADITLVGTAHAPAGAVVTEREVRLTVLGAGGVVLDKALLVRGEAASLAVRKPFRAMRLGYDLAYGGSGVTANPVGRGTPSVVHRHDPRRPAGFGPIAPTWSPRAERASPAQLASLGEAEVRLGPGFDLGYFNSAPADQQVGFLRGDERLVLVGLDPLAGEVTTQLPGLVAHACMEFPDGIRRVVPLVLDTLAIDSDEGQVGATFRGYVALAGLPSLDAGARLLVTLAPLGREPDWPASSPGSPAAGPAEVRESEPTRATVPARTGEVVPWIVAAPSYAAASFPWRFRPREDSLVVLVKATYALGDDGSLALCPRSRPPSGDLFLGEPGASSLTYPSDFVPARPACDVVVLGAAHAEPGKATALVTLRLGSIDKSVVAIGERRWLSDGSPSPPAPFVSIPLHYEVAFGGPSSRENPVGVGQSVASRVPGLEVPARMLRRAGDVVPAAGLGPIAPTWPQRAIPPKLLDAEWLAGRWPFLPAGFDPALWQAAPADQRLPYPRGGEAFRVTSVRPGGGGWAGQLPTARPRVFAVRQPGDRATLEPLTMHLDTVVFDLTAEPRLVLVWRCSLRVSDDEASDVRALFLTSDESEAPLSLAAAVERLDTTLAARALPDLARPKVPLAPAAAVVAAAVVADWLASPAGLAGRDLRGADLAGLDLRGKDLSGAQLRGANLRGARLDGATLTRVRAGGVDLREASLRGASLEQADLTGAQLAGACLAEARLAQATLAAADATGADLRACDATGAFFPGARLDAAVFTGAKLSKADLSGATLDGARFEQADLSDAKLYEARGQGVVADGATMTDARLEAAELPGSSFQKVMAPGSIWERAVLTGARFLDADLRGAGLVKARASGAIFSRADLREARLRKAVLDGASFLKANLMQASLEKADLTKADLRGANLYQAETWEAQLAGADLTQANVDGTKLAPKARA